MGSRWAAHIVFATALVAAGFAVKQVRFLNGKTDGSSGLRASDVHYEALDRERVRATIELTNCADRPIEVARIQPSCSCLDVQLTPLVIPPRGVSVLTVLLRAIESADHTVTIICLVDGVLPDSITVTVNPAAFAAVGREDQATSPPVADLVPGSMK